MKRALVISIHDVSPLTRPDVEKILAELWAMQVPACSLLVVPDHHHRAPIRDDPTFGVWLRQQAHSGNEIVMHGYFHQRAPANSESILNRLITRVYTAGEGEFYDIERDEARRLLQLAREEFARLELPTPGFIAPAWLLSDDALTALTELNFDYTTRLGDVVDLKKRKRFRSQSIVYSTRTAWRRVLSRFWNRFLFSRLNTNRLLRISIHPPDLQYPKIWRQIRRLILRALEDRQPLTYEAWIMMEREASSASPDVLQS